MPSNYQNQMHTYYQLVGPLGTDFNQVLIKIHKFSLRKMCLKKLSAQYLPFCPVFHADSPSMMEYTSKLCKLCNQYKHSQTVFSTVGLDYFTVSLHSPNGRQFACRLGCVRDCQWILKNSGNSHLFQWILPRILCSLVISQSIFRSINHTANWRLCLIPHWPSYSHRAGTV